ncbi:uncharacterized protein [Pyxicephalus adspersus]
MGLKGIKQIHLIWVTLSLIALSRSQNISSINNLGCVNDFLTEIFCSWESVGSNRSCSEDFTLTYTDLEQKEEKCQDLQNEQSGGTVVPNKCICHITVPFFVIADTYLIAVNSHGQPVANTTINISTTFKLRAPSNVRIKFQKEQNCLVQWNTGYEDSFIRKKLTFHVQILFKKNRKLAKEDFLIRLEPQYIFNKRQLERGEEYVVRVRTKPAENKDIEGIWGQWSSEAEWKNDYSLTLQDLQNIIIPITCIVILFSIIGSYFCLNRYKKWWNNIPNPAKSKLAQSKLLQNHPSNSDGKYPAKSSCGRFLSKIVKVHKSKCDQLTQQLNSKDYVNICGGYNYKKVIFEPEVEDIERCVNIYPKKENEKVVLENKQEHSAEDHLMEGDLSIAKMFFDILCDSSGIKVDTFKNINTSTFGGSGWMDSFGKMETQRCNSGVSAYRESGYNSYGSDDSPVDFLLDIDGFNSSYFGHWPDNEEDDTPYTPQDTIHKDFLYQQNDDPLESSGHTSFANALIDKRKDFFIDSFKTFCLDSLPDNTVLCKNNSFRRLLPPKSVLYYNTKHLFSHNKDSFQSIIRPEPEQGSEFTLQCYESKSDPISICPVSGYQSFDQAVKESDPELGCNMSGYKSFDQAVHEGGPDSGCELSGYQSFDQAVQEGGPDSGCQLSGYQSFDQAVHESGPDSGCQLSGYQSFDQAVQEGGPDSGCQVFGYQSFDQAVHEGGPDSGCQLSGYQSFDQAVHEGDENSVCQKTCERQQSESSGSTNFLFDSEYKPSGNLTSQYSAKDTSKNGIQYQLGDSQLQTNTESSKTEKVVNVTDNNNSKTINSQKHDCLLSSLTQFWLGDFVQSTNGKYHPSKHLSDKSIKTLKIAVDTFLDNDMTATHKNVPFTLTFDICEHLKNLENNYGHKVSPNSLIFPCHPNEIQFIQEQLNTNKYLTSPKCPPTKSDNFENLSYFIPLRDLEALGSNQQNKHLLIQQRNEDKDGNSYMKLVLP